MENKILLVEDNVQIQEFVVDYFNTKSKGEMEIVIANTGDEALDKIYETEFDLVLLDIMLPGVDGFTICREIRQKSIVPIIFITARVSEEDVLYGYDLGCDDYVTKPFSVTELYAKVQALLKRAKGMVCNKILSCGEITLNPTMFEVKVDGNLIDLPPKQYGLLKYLLEHKGHVVTRESLLCCIWGYDYEGTDRVVDNHVKKLRQALGNGGKNIRTVVGRGYKIAERE